MKRLQFGQCMGIGLSLFAAFGVYHLTMTEAPSNFDADSMEFRSLSEYRNRFETDSTGKAILAKFDDLENDENQIQLPGTVDIKPNQLRLSPALSDSPTELAIDLNRPQPLPAIRDTERTADQPSIPMNGPGEVAASESDPEGEMYSDVDGSSWQSNPFLNGDGEASDPVAKYVEAVEIANGGSLVKEFASEHHQQFQPVKEVPVSKPIETELPSPTPQIQTSEFQPSVSHSSNNDFVVPQSPTNVEAEQALDLTPPLAPQEVVADNPESIDPFENQLDGWEVAGKTDAVPEVSSQSKSIFETAEPHVNPEVAENAQPGLDETDNNSFELTPSSPSPPATNLASQPVQSQTVDSQTMPSQPVPLQTAQSQPDELGQQYPVQSLGLGITESVAQRAAQHIEYGKALARRGATHVARQEFYAALRVVAQAGDENLGAIHYSRSLKRGILALKEAEDFLIRDTETQMGLDTGLVVETHKSGILSSDQTQNMTPVRAMQLYLASAQKELEAACGQNAVSGEALYCLGKLHSMSSEHVSTSGSLDIAKSIVYHRAAIHCDDQNYRSTNELGVLLARAGQLDEAKRLFKQSLRVKSLPHTWLNLAKVHQRRGESEMAELALSEYRLSMQSPIDSNDSRLHWVSSSEFNMNAPIETHASVANNPAESETTKTKEPKSLGQKLKDLF